MRTRFPFVVLAALISLPVLAHHNYRLRYDYDVAITLTGIITKFDWKNPHVELYMDVEDKNGNVTNWTMPTAAICQVSMARPLLARSSRYETRKTHFQ